VFCLRAINLLHEKAEQFNYYPMDEAESTLSYIKETYDHKTVPVITYNIDGEERLIGGYDDLVKHLRQQEDKESN
tara:strand:+ start:716 stop:940 length:225 start_codon:yes stop_codon:yes gene_type:complete